jgi:thiol-disulfide isomerase/thioredoxin
MRSLLLKIFLCLSLLPVLNCGAAGDKGSEEVRVGGRVPSFSLESLDGATVTSRSLEGSVVVLNFWATWCAPCRTEIPDLKQVAASPEVKVLGIALDEDGAKSVKPFVERFGINYTVVLGDQELFQRFNGFGIPYTLVLDRSQRIVNIYRGPASKESLEQDLKRIDKAI